MKRKIYLIIFIVLVVILICSIILINKKTNKEETEEMQELTKEEFHNDNTERALVFDINREEEVAQEETKDAAQLTNEIYSINGPIGHLYIPKTGLNTDIYSNQTVEKMEEMPCFIYTTGGLNQVGITLITGHNRVNGTLFSNNGKLDVGDEFYFKDLSENELKYKIITKEILKDSDASYLQKDVNKPTMILSCCTDENDDYRIVITGQAE